MSCHVLFVGNPTLLHLIPLPSSHRLMLVPIRRRPLIIILLFNSILILNKYRLLCAQILHPSHNILIRRPMRIHTIYPRSHRLRLLILLLKRDISRVPRLMLPMQLTNPLLDLLAKQEFC